MTQRHFEDTDDHDVVYAGRDVLGIVKFRYGHVTSLPGQERANGEHETFVDVDGNSPVDLVVVMTIHDYVRVYNVVVNIFLEEK